MKPMPKEFLNPKVKAVWRISDAIWITMGAIIVLGCSAILVAIPESSEFGSLLFAVFAGAAVVLYILFLGILPPIRYMRWRYEVSPEFLEIAKGIIWRKRYTIPFIRVQNTDTRQGPIMRAFGLASVTVSTAAQEHEIPGLAVDQADALRDKAAEFARVAREDV